MTGEFKKKFLLNILFYSVVLTIVFFIVKFLFAYLFPLIIGIFVTVCVQRPSTYFSSLIGIKKGYCALVLVAFIYIMLISVVVAVFIKSGSYISEFATGNHGILITVSNTFNAMLSKLQKIDSGIPTEIGEWIRGVLDDFLVSITGYISNSAKNIAKATPMFLTSSVVTVIASIYIAKDFDRFADSINSVISEKYKKAISETKFLLKDSVQKILSGYIKLLLITFIEVLIGLSLLRVDKALILSVVIALLDLLPVIGTGTILIPWGIYNIVTGQYFLGIGLLIVYIIISLIRNIIEPKIIGKQIGLHPLIALIAVFIGLKLFGFLGIFLLPLTIMIAYKMYDRGIFDLIFSE